MKKVLAIVAILILGVGIYLVWAFKFKSGSKEPKGPEPLPLAVSKHSDAFNTSAQELLRAYYAMTESFVNWDSVKVQEQAMKLKASLDSLRLAELQPDTVIYQSSLDPWNNARSNTDQIISSPTLAQKRVAFNALSEDLRLLMIVIKYDRAKMYWQECPMAFGEDQPGFWLSETDVVRNPYMGTSHPQYKDGMLSCGAPKDTINFTIVDTTRKG